MKIEVAPGVTLTVGVPEGARDEGEGALAAIDVSAVPGARVVLRRALRVEPASREAASPSMRVQAACVVAPSDRWAPGLEELVLGRATGLATASLSAPVERWEPAAIERSEGRFEQRLAGRRAGVEVAAIRHSLAFVGADHEVLLCSIGCASGASGASGASSASGGACSEILSRSELTGALVGPPPPSLLVRAVLLAAERPYECGAGAAALAVAVIAALLARRPKVPGRRAF